MKTKKFIKSVPHLPVKKLRLTLDYYRDKLGFSDEWTLLGTKMVAFAGMTCDFFLQKTWTLQMTLTIINIGYLLCGLLTILTKFLLSLRKDKLSLLMI
jgi:hypothetical protein